MLVAEVRKPPMESHKGELPPQQERVATEEAVAARFRQSPYSDLRSVRCDLFEGKLTLRGQVRSYYLKQLAQELVRPLEAVEQINNRLKVIRSAAHS